MLKAFGLLVDLFPTVAQDLVEEHLQQAVAAQDPHGHLTPLAGEGSPVVGLVFQQPGLLQLPQHVGDGSIGHVQVTGHPGGAGPLLHVLDLEDHLEIVLHRAGDGCLPLRFSCHRIAFRLSSNQFRVTEKDTFGKPPMCSFQVSKSSLEIY